MHGFKYITTLLVTLTKDYKVKNDDGTTEEKTEYAMLYFNSYTKRIINENFRDDLDLSFEEIINKIQNWIKDGSGWAIDLVNGEYVHVSKYDPLHACSYLELPKKYAHPRKGLINIKNKNNKCFLWCHVRYLNLDCGKDPGRISKKDKEIAYKLDYSGIDFPVSEKDYLIIENRFNLGVNIFSYDDSYNVYPVYISKSNYNDCMDLLLIHSDEVDEDTYENKNHYVYIKDFNRFIFNKTKCKNKKCFCKVLPSMFFK